MNVLLWLIPLALFLGLLGLGAFLWALKSGQFEDLDGAAHRILGDASELVAAAIWTSTTPVSWWRQGCR